MTQRIDSTSGQISAIQSEANGLPEPPPHVRVPESAMPAWWAVVSSKRRDAWTAHDLTLAAELARSLADLEDIRVQLDDVGRVIAKANGDPAVHPLCGIEDGLVKRVLSLSRAIQVHALATQGRSENQSKRNAAGRDARGVGDDDDLIAPPSGGEGMH